MRLILHDLEETEFRRLFPELLEDSRVVSPGGEEASGKLSPCVGCFACWLKTPGVCIVRDGYGAFGPVLAKCTDYFILSRVVYGGFSLFVKNVLDRNIGYLLPFFTKRRGEMHHASRYPGQFRLHVLGYGEEVPAEEQQTFRGIAAANARNLNAEDCRVSFAPSPELLALRKEEWI